ncbi:MAG: hypothetical protein IT365_13205 [Candidatus Hydrogenedentes bacterium]|nr:hypothetical protein [Candidatus Hydrogenedentota bacterium]
MRIVQTIIQKLACVAVLAGGVAVLFFSANDLYRMLTVDLPGSNEYVRLAVACGVAALALFALIPLGGGRRKSNQIKFDGLTIQLDSVAATLNKTVGKLPIIKKATVHVHPNKAANKALVVADVSIIKPADTGARETGDQLRVYIDETARRVLGADEIENVEVNIVGIDVDKTAAPVDWKEPTPAPTPARAIAAAAEGLVMSQAAAEPAPSSDLVTYEESISAVEDEEESLTGPAQEEEEKPLPVAWDDEPETHETAQHGEDPEAPLDDDVEIVDENNTSFAELADDEPAGDTQAPDSKDAEDTRRDTF